MLLMLHFYLCLPSCTFFPHMNGLVVESLTPTDGYLPRLKFEWFAVGIFTYNDSFYLLFLNCPQIRKANALVKCHHRRSAFHLHGQAKVALAGTDIITSKEGGYVTARVCPLVCLFVK